MSVTDPLLKELKGYIAIIVLKNSENALVDENSDLIFSLCYCLENILAKGLVRYDGFTPWKTDPFQWFYQLVRKYQRTLPLKFKVIFDQVLANEKTKTSVGKTRLLLRTCLKQRCLYIPIQFHIENQDYNSTSLHVNYSKSKSILGNEILVQIFFSLLQQLSFYTFPFDLTNCSFLDESWHLPNIAKTEMVPCQKLGLTLGFPLGFAMIVEIIPNSCADEIRDLISVGDILDDINGIPTRNLYGSKIDELFKKVRSEPFQLTFVKGRNHKTGQIYLPIIKLYRILGLDPLLLESHREGDEFLSPPFSSTNNECDTNKMSRSDESAKETAAYKQATTREKDEVADLLSTDSPTKSSNLPENSPNNEQNQKPSSKSQIQPYPQSQNNTSSNSALNLQMYNTQEDQLIV